MLIVIVHIDSTTPMAYPLTAAQSRDLLRFCRSVGVVVFAVDFIVVQSEESELANAFYRRFSRFSAGERVLETLYGDSFTSRECWILNDESVEAILTETAGDLFAYDLLNLPEDWLFYLGDTILLQVVSHEQEATLRLSEKQYSEFINFGIPHEQGQPQFTGLPEKPLRGSPPLKPT